MSSKIALNHLNTFYQVATKLSFQDAAVALFVTPSAVSHQIRALEQTLQYKLFKRIDKGVLLTEQGKALFMDIEQPMQQLHEASRKAMTAHDHALTISVAPIFATGWLLPRLKDFYQRHPQIELHVLASFNLIDFERDPVDAAIRIGPLNEKLPEAIRLLHPQYVAVCHPSLLHEKDALFTPYQLLEHSILRNSAMPNLLEQWFASAQVKADGQHKRVVEVPSTAQVIDALQAGNCIGIVDRHFIAKELELGRLALACEHVFDSQDCYHLIAPERTQTLPQYAHFIDWLEEQLR